MLILTKQGQKCGILSKIRKIEKHCKSLYINYFVAFSFLCLRRLCSGSGYSERLGSDELSRRFLFVLLRRADRLKRVCFHLCEGVFPSVCGRGAAFRSVECMFRPVECRFYGSGCMFQPVERSVCRRRAARHWAGQWLKWLGRRRLRVGAGP